MAHRRSGSTATRVRAAKQALPRITPRRVAHSLRCERHGAIDSSQRGAIRYNERVRTFVTMVSLVALSACPPGADSKVVSCVPDGGTSGCFEWENADLATFGAIEATCGQLSALVQPGVCASEYRVIGCKVDRAPASETRWFKVPSFETLSECPDAGRLVVFSSGVLDAGTVPESDGGQCSGPAGDAAMVFFGNVGSSTVHLRWVTQSCGEVGYPSIAPGGGVNQPTFIGHVWRIRRDRPDGPLIREFVVSAPSASVLVR